MIVLAQFLKNIHKSQAETERLSRISIINTDNVFLNGSKLNELVMSVISESSENTDEFVKWMKEYVTFHNTMVDRITSHREGDPNVPMAEPLPSKALVIQDLHNRLPFQFESFSDLGVN